MAVSWRSTWIGGQTVEHSVSDSPVSALAVVSTGHPVVADRSGQLIVMKCARRALRFAVDEIRARRQRALAELQQIADGGGFDFDKLDELDQ
jgi:hypothetical protein